MIGHKVSHALRCDRELLAAGPLHGIGFLLTKLTEVVLTGKTLHSSLSRKLHEIEQHETVGRGLFRTFRGLCLCLNELPEGVAICCVYNACPELYV